MEKTEIGRYLAPNPTLPVHMELKTFMIRFLVQSKIKNHIIDIYISKANHFRGDIRTHVGMLCHNLLLRRGPGRDGARGGGERRGFTLLVLS